MKRLSLRERRTKFYICITSLLVLSASVALMPVGFGLKEKTMVLFYVSGAAFWAGLIGVIVSAISLNSARKTDPVFRTQYRGPKRFGLISFFSNVPAIVFDGLTLLSAVGIIVAFLAKGSVQLQLIAIASFAFSFGMHCILNGVNYIYVNFRSRRDN